MVKRKISPDKEVYKENKIEYFLNKVEGTVEVIEKRTVGGGMF